MTIRRSALAGMLITVAALVAPIAARAQEPPATPQPPCADLLARTEPAQKELQAANDALARLIEGYNTSVSSLQQELTRAIETLQAVQTEVSDLAMLGSGTIAESAIQIELERQAAQQRLEQAQAKVEEIQQRITDASPSQFATDSLQQAVEAAFARYEQIVREYQECIAR